jgi:hypothetical protein
MQSHHLVGRDIDGDDITCSGRQIALVLELLLSLRGLSDCVWYAGSIDCFGNSIEPFHQHRLKIVTNPTQLVEAIRAKTQLLDGVFVAIRGLDPPQMLTSMVTAYSSTDRIAANSILEVRAFDSQSVEVYTDNPLITARVQARFAEI